MPPNVLKQPQNLNLKSWPSGPRSLWVKKQYVALLEAVGTPKIARELMEDIIVWPWTDAVRPPDHLVKTWEMEWYEGKFKVADLDTKRMRQRLMAFEEWGNRAAIRAVREALVAVAEAAKEGTLDLKRQVTLKYLADGLAMTTRDTSQAFGTPKPTPSQINKLVINAGTPPKKLKAAKPAVIIDAEVRELPVGNGT